MTYLADSHAHLVDKAYKKDEGEVVQRAYDNGVRLIINVGYDLKTSLASVDLAGDYDFIYTAAGIHPHDAKNVPDNYQDRLKKLAGKDKVVAIGEMGLDYYRDMSPRKVQQEVFREQLMVAQELKLPVIIHDREAHEDVLKIIEEEEGGKNGGVFHCFSGDWTMAKRCLELGFYVSIAGPVTFKNSKTLQEVARKLPLDKILVETDCPYLTPVPFRGKRNEPAYVKYTAEQITSIRNMNWEELALATYENTKRVFNID